MISPKDFVTSLKKRGFRSFTGVPCSFFQAAIHCVIDDRELRYTIMPNEGSALAFAAGAQMAGAPTALMIQNSGFGNLVNPLTSLNMIYGIPCLIFISGRAYGVKDEPQHEIIGKTMGPALSAFGVRYEDMPEELEAFQDSLDAACEYMETQRQPFVFFVRRGTVDDAVMNRPAGANYPLKRIDAIRIVSEAIGKDDYVVATTGKPSRELFSVSDRSKNFYMQGSMGHAASVGLGVALNKPEKKVIVLDGDGAVLMHMGALSSIGYYKSLNFYHIVLDNEAYESTGNQDTTSASTDFKAVAKACGYARAEEAKTADELKNQLKFLLTSRGPILLRVKINRLPTADIPRISSKYSSKQIAEAFSAGLSSK